MLHLNNKKEWNSFCIVFDLHYLCTRKQGYLLNPL